VVKKEFYNYQYCRTRKAKPINQQMGNFPQIRLTPKTPLFTYTGVDYFGLTEVTIGKRHEKRWMVLFTCITIRAVHIEIAASLTTDTDIMATDNGTKFQGADNELKNSIEDLNQKKLQE
jgi:hypothetical protein